MIADGDSEKAKGYREKYVHTLGNLTLTGYNQNLSNMSFDNKKNRKGRDGKNMGYLNGLFLNEDIAARKKWTVDDIINRTEKIVAITKQIYSW